MNKLLISKNDIRAVEKRLGFTYTFAPVNGEESNISSGSSRAEDYEQVPIEILGRKKLFALTYYLQYMSDCDKEHIRKLYIGALSCELATREPGTAKTFQKVINTALAYSCSPSKQSREEMTSVSKYLETLRDECIKEITDYRQELTYLNDTMSQRWFMQNTSFCTNFQIQERTIYSEYPKRAHFLSKEICRMQGVIDLCAWVIPTLNLDFNLHDSCPSSKCIKAVIYLDNALIEYLKNNRTKDIELYMKNLENKEFVTQQLCNKINYFEKFRLLDSGKIGKKLFVKRSKTSIEIFVVPEDYEGVDPAKSRKSEVVKVFGKIGTSSDALGWLYDGDWIKVVLDHVTKLNEDETLRLSNESKSKLKETLDEVSNISDILSGF